MPAEVTAADRSAPVPHLQVRLAEDDLAPAVEERIIAELTEAIVAVYGEWARPLAVVEIVGIPAGRWGIGGVRAAPVPAVTLNIRAEALLPPDGDARAARLIAEQNTVGAARCAQDRPPGVRTSRRGGPGSAPRSAPRSAG
jgi:phenylpyruvate tautomerase PptA (4-oxalocrotonate tautomerase family)